MKRILFAPVLLLAALCPRAAVAQPTPSTRTPVVGNHEGATMRRSVASSRLKGRSDAAFIREVLSNKLAETDLSKKVMNEIDGQGIRKFANILAQDATVTREEAQDIAQRRGVSSTGILPRRDQRIFDRLILGGSDVDQQYLQATVKFLQEDALRFRAEAMHGRDKEVRDWAQSVLRRIMDHLNVAKDMRLTG